MRRVAARSKSAAPSHYYPTRCGVLVSLHVAAWSSVRSGMFAGNGLIPHDYTLISPL